jgi:alpha-L-fucosidase 2
MTTHNPQAIFNTDLSGGFPALLIRMLVESQPGYIELLPAWSLSLPAGKIKGVALRGQVTMKELSWNGKTITVSLISPIAQQIELKAPGEIESFSGINQAVKKTAEKLELSLPAGRETKIVLKLR